jgi:hypothetical protein
MLKPDIKKLAKEVDGIYRLLKGIKVVNGGIKRSNRSITIKANKFASDATLTFAKTQEEGNTIDGKLSVKHYRYYSDEEIAALIEAGQTTEEIGEGVESGTAFDVYVSMIKEEINLCGLTPYIPVGTIVVIERIARDWYLTFPVLTNGTVLAKTQEASQDSNKISVKLVDASGAVVGDAFYAYANFLDGATSMQSVTPLISSGVLVPIYKIQNGNWCLDVTFTSVGDECEE